VVAGSNPAVPTNFHRDNMMINLNQTVLDAETRIRPYLAHTPLRYADQLSALTTANVYLKLENLQPTSAFKVRGAFNKLLTLSPKQRKIGVVTGSTGNHGAAVSYACNQLQIPNLIFVPSSASPVKINNIKAYGGTVEFYGSEVGETELYARDYAQQHGKTYIPPYNDIDVLSGQGTIAYELLQQSKDIDVPLDTILVPVGGGGLIAGIAGYVKSVNPHIKIIGCEPENSPVMSECVKAGKIVELDIKPSFSDGTAGNLEPDSITFNLCQSYVDDYILVSEEEIKNAMRLFIEKEHLLIEGAAGVCIAALLKNQADFKNKNVVLIISGANISLETLKKIIN
jgi:threonine dehydratase